MSRQSRIGTEPNLLKLAVRKIEIESHSLMVSGIIEEGVIITFSQYDCNDLLVQMLEDYGEEELIKRIKALD